MSLYLPLDDRPANLLLVILLAALAGQPLCVWDRFEGVAAKQHPKKSRPRALSTMQLPPSEETPLIALNSLAAGSLVGSRVIDPSTLPTPTLPPEGLYLFCVPRLEPTANTPENKEAYRLLRIALADPGLQQQVVHVLQEAAPIDSLPEGAIRRWASRTGAWISWLERLRLPPDRLLVLIDDNRQGPLSTYLRERYGQLSAHVFDGTDEGGQLLLARAAVEQSGKHPRLAVIATSPGTFAQRGRYEGLGVERLVLKQAAWLGIELLTQLPVDDSPVLLIHNWSTKQGDRHDQFQGNPNPIAEDFTSFWPRLAGHPVFVADLAYANGGDPEFAAALWGAKAAGLLDLRGYSGWNTTANSLGTALSECAIHAVTPHSTRMLELEETLLIQRLLEDVLYQSRLRQALEHRLRDACADPWTLTPLQAAEFEDRMTNELRTLGFQQGYLRAPDGWSLQLPWQRTFEATITTSELRRIYRETPHCD